jgi:hypothetical protein
MDIFILNKNIFINMKFLLYMYIVDNNILYIWYVKRTWIHWNIPMNKFGEKTPPKFKILKVKSNFEANIIK